MVQPLSYLDLDLSIDPGTGGYLVRLDSSAGEARGTLRLPAHSAPGLDPGAVRDFGRALFDALFGDQVRSCYDVSRVQAESEGKGLRIRLRLGAPELAALPWEYLCDPRTDAYLALSHHTPIVRYLELPRPARPLTASLPLRVLAVIANPADMGTLDTGRERERIEGALRSLGERGGVQVDWLSPPTRQALQRALRGDRYHILHFVGHGRFDRRRGEGVLFLEDDQRRADPLPASALAPLLADQRALRLAVLNACESAVPGEEDLFASTAATLVRAGLPAVLAMQFPITDRAAVAFSQAFYESIAAGLPLDAALAEARKAINLALEDAVEWGAPVLYTHAPGGQVFALARSGPSASPSAPLKVHRAYVVQSALFYYPVFLQDPEALIRPLRFLARGDMRTLFEDVDPDLDPDRVQYVPAHNSAFIRRVGPVVDPLAQFSSGWADDWDTGIDNWLIPPLRAPHTRRGHLPYLVPANWSFRLHNAPGDGPAFQLRPTLKLHVYPYGVVDALLCSEFSCPDGMEVGHLTRLLNGLSHVRQRRGRGAVFEVASAHSAGSAHPRLNTAEMLVTVADTLNRALFGRPQPRAHGQDPRDAPLSTLVILARTTPALSPADRAKELCGLVRGVEDWAGLDAEYAKPYGESDHGRRAGDYVKLGRLHSLVRVTQPGHRAGRRRLYWSLFSRIQLARIEAFLYRYYAAALNDIWREQQQDRERAWEAFKHWLSMRGDYAPQGDLFYFWDDLLGFSGQPLGGHRPLYERAAELAGVAERRTAFEREFAAFVKYGARTEPRLLTAWKRLSPLHALLKPFL